MSPGTGPLLLLSLFCAGYAAVSLASVEDSTKGKGAHKKPGTCPADVDYPTCKDSMLSFENECKVDQDCDGKSKCCFSGCRRRCRLPLGVKNGVCPYFNNRECMHIKPEPYECENDNQCRGTDRCCNYRCRNQCMPTEKEKPGTCPADVDYPTCKDSMLSFENECKVDQDCDGKSKCCFSGCRRRCRLPLGVKNGVCPYFNNRECMHIKPEPYECENDNQCQGTDRCCNYRCRNQCMPTEKVKPGQCPIPITICAFNPPPPLCHSDSDCNGKEKCCISACNKACIHPEP